MAQIGASDATTRGGLAAAHGAGARGGLPSDLPIAGVTAFLREVLGDAVVLHVTRTADRDAPQLWEDGTQRPPAPVDSRLRTAYRSFQVINAVDNEFGARAWFIGTNPHLGDEAPATAIAADRHRDVLVAAEAFVRTS